jgi:four helix bundle protein
VKKRNGKREIVVIYYVTKLYFMFLNLNHYQLNVVKATKAFVIEAYKFSKTLHPEERFNLVQQIRRVSVSVYLNLNEGSSRKSKLERNRFFEISRSSVVEVDAALDVSEALGYCNKNEWQLLGIEMSKSFAMLSKMISSSEK